MRRERPGDRVDGVLVLLGVLARLRAAPARGSRRRGRRRDAARCLRALGWSRGRRCAARAARVSRRPVRRRGTSSMRGTTRARRSSRCRTSSGPSTFAMTSRASTTLSSSPARMRRTASATSPCQSIALTLPSDQVTHTGASGTDTGGSAGRGPGSWPMTVIQACPARRPTMTWGTTTIDGPESGSNEKEPNATGPVPGMLTVSSTSNEAHRFDHQRWVRLKRSSPRTSSRAATPQPMRPSPLRTQATGSVTGRRARSSSGSAIGRVTTREACRVGGGFDRRPRRGHEGKA